MEVDYLTIKEFGKVAAILKSAYTSEKLLADNYSMNVWFKLLEDLDYQLVGVVIQQYILTNKFPPSIADIRELYFKNQQETMTESEAWALVTKALRNSTYNSTSEYEKLPMAVKKAVGSPEQLKAWAVDPDFNGGVESSNFKRAYKTYTEREQKQEQLPPSLKKQLEQLFNTEVKQIGE